MSDTETWSDPEVGAGWLLDTVRAKPDGSVAEQLRRDVEFADWWALLSVDTKRRIRLQLRDRGEHTQTGRRD